MGVSKESTCNAAIGAVLAAPDPDVCERIKEDNLKTCQDVSKDKFEEILDAHKTRLKQLLKPMCEGCLYQRDCEGLIKYRKHALNASVSVTDKYTGKWIHCHNLADEMEVDLPRQIADEDEMKDYDALARETPKGYTEPGISQEVLDAEMVKNKTYWNNLNEDSSALDARRAEAYIIQRIAQDVNATGDFALDYYLDKETIRRMEILNKLITTKYECKYCDHYFAFCPHYASDHGNKPKDPDAKPLPYCESSEYQKAVNDDRFIRGYKPKSKRYENGFKLNPISDQAYLLGLHGMSKLNDKHEYLNPYNELPVYPSSSEQSRYINGDCLFSELYRFWKGRTLQHFALNYKVINEMHTKNGIETQEQVNEELKELKEMYPKAAALCKDNASCKAFALKETLKQRDLIYLNSSVIYDPDIMPQNDDVFMTEQFKKWFSEIPAEEMNGFRVPDAAMIRDHKLKVIAAKWEETKDDAPKSGMSDAAAEKAVKTAVEALDPKLKVKKVIFDSKWRMSFASNGVPESEWAYAAVCIADPDRKGVVLCTYDYSVFIEKEYTGGAKLREVGVTTRFHGNTAHSSIDYDYQGGAKFGPPEVSSLDHKALMFRKTNTPNNYYIAKNLK